MTTSMKINLSDVCFLCKSEVEATDEHVFPKWLQNRFDLWDESIVLKNGTRIRYKDLKIPCCKQCNTKYLSQIESSVSALLEKDDLPGLLQASEALFIWLYKIMYGINYKEIFLSHDRKEAKSQKIVSMESLASRDAYNAFVRYVRNEVVFEGFSPYSLFVFRLSDSTPKTFFYASEPYRLFASAIIGNVGVIASFQDDGYITRDFAKFNVLNGLTELSVPQFGDLSAFVLALKIRMKKLPDYVVTAEKERLVFRIQPPPEDPLYSDFNPEKHMEITRTAFGYCFERLIREGASGMKEINYRSPFRYF